MIAAPIHEIQQSWALLHQRSIPLPYLPPDVSCDRDFDEKAAETALGALRVFRWGHPADQAEVVQLLAADHPWALEQIAGLISNQAVNPSISADVDGRLLHGERILSLCREMLISRRLSAPCLWSGATLTTQTCLVFPAVPWKTPCYAYRFSGKEVFYLLIQGFTNCAIVGIYIPLRQAAIVFSNQHRDAQECRQQIVALRVFLIRFADRIGASLAKPDTERHPALLFHSPHFAHSLWNEVSAVEPLLDCIDAECRLHVMFEPNGPLDVIYPELPPHCLYRHAGISDSTEFFLQVLEAGAFAVPLGRAFIPRTVIKRVMIEALRAHPEDGAFSKQIRATHDFVLWITIRTDVRICLNQRQILARIIDRVSKRCSALAVVIDGFTPGYKLGTSARILDSERSVASDIIDAVNARCTFIQLMGAEIRQAFVWGGIADLYVANHGSIQHKLAWLHDVLGIAHAPYIADFNPANNISLIAREGCAIPIYVYGQESSQQSHGARDARVDLFDYNLDSDKVDAAVDLLLESTASDSNSRKSRMPGPTRKAVHAIDETFYLRESTQTLRDAAAQAWSKGNWADAFSNFAEAVKLAPKLRQTHDSLLCFLLMTYRSWFRDSASVRASFFALLFVSELNRNDVWTRAQLLETILDITDDGQAATMLKTLLTYRPELSPWLDSNVETIVKSPESRTRLLDLFASVLRGPSPKWG